MNYVHVRNKNFSYILGILPTIQPIELNKGLVFLKDRDILLTGDKWTIVLEVAFDDYITLIKSMQDAISNITRAIPELDDYLYLFLGGTHIQIGTKAIDRKFTPVYRTEVQRPSRMIEEIKADVE